MISAISKHTTTKQLESTFISRSVTSQRPFSTAHCRTVRPGKHSTERLLS